MNLWSSFVCSLIFFTQIKTECSLFMVDCIVLRLHLARCLNWVVFTTGKVSLKFNLGILFLIMVSHDQFSALNVTSHAVFSLDSVIHSTAIVNNRKVKYHFDRFMLLIINLSESSVLSWS
jgi:hypothetical protein